MLFFFNQLFYIELTLILGIIIVADQQADLAYHYCGITSYQAGSRFGRYSIVFRYNFDIIPIIFRTTIGELSNN